MYELMIKSCWKCTCWISGKADLMASFCWYLVHDLELDVLLKLKSGVDFEYETFLF
jgi:hypothetical protein